MGHRFSDRDIHRWNLCVRGPGSGRRRPREINLLFVPRAVPAGADRWPAAQIELEPPRIIPRTPAPVPPYRLRRRRTPPSTSPSARATTLKINS